MSDQIKKLLPHFIAIIFFIGLSFAYFSPQLEGKRIEQGDIISFTGMRGELDEFSKETGKTYHWNNSMFSGMPWGLLTYARNYNYSRKFAKLLNLGIQRPAGLFITGMLCTYLVLVLLGISPWFSAIAAAAFGFNVNFMVLLEAGHNTKLQVITYLPLVIGGMLLVLRNKELLGSVVFTIGLSLAIFSNHIQMVYYLGLMLGVFYLFHIGFAFKELGANSIVRKTMYLLLGCLLAAGANSGQLLSAKKYSDDTMRGAPILESADGNKSARSSSEVKGLEWNYAMSWSNGVKDLASILIPRAVGGSSGEEIGPDTEAGRLLRQSGASSGSDGNYKAPMYWGALPFTSGPYYLGSVVMLLFCLSLFQMKPKYRWGILAAFLLCLLLSLGKNASWLNRTLFDIFPLFNKFRSPNSVMNVSAVIVTIPAFIGAYNLFTRKDKMQSIKHLYYSIGIVGGAILLMLLAGMSSFSFESAGDSRYQEEVRNIFINTRRTIFRQDAIRSLLFVLAAGGVLWAYLQDRIKSNLAVFGVIGLLVIVDLWSVDKRYFDSDKFVSKNEYSRNFALRKVDQQIKKNEPKGRGYYRVLDLSINTFNSSSTSKHHNTIGGYNAAKLQRYQDLIDYHISQGNQGVLNMLNTKYIIGQNGQLQTNPGALGSAWFVNDVVEVNSPKEEISRLGTINTSNQAVVLRDEFNDELEGFTPGDGLGSITLDEYEPNRLVYNSNTQQDQLAVFSEVWYGPNKGWKVTIDGQETEMLRANYLLRALIVPSGSHKIEFTFKPSTPALPRISSIICSLLIIAGFLFLLYKEVVQPLMASGKNDCSGNCRKVNFRGSFKNR